MKQRAKKQKFLQNRAPKYRNVHWMKEGRSSFTIQFTGTPVKLSERQETVSFTWPAVNHALDRRWLELCVTHPKTPSPSLTDSFKENIKKILQPVDEETINALRPKHPEVDLYDTMVIRDEESGKVKIFTGCYPTSMG